ncbi:hypothetical protein [Methylosinus sp. Sm6]|uniref:hypothetical protein n=1 Tax=Methylosinus sp. Sm6 TaxID=2866948 RepID=UPI001C9A21C1|nr:hypothetical protein [Methylosinus sp. Sm6]MBY6241077.1 hypothetical protein [Methylosinus sp. Sm6]
MVSPISALTSSSPGVRALSRVAAVAAKAESVPALDDAPASAPAAPSPGPGLRDALPAGYRNLNLPVGAADTLAQSAAATTEADSPLAAAYGPTAAALAELPRLIGARLPMRTILRETQAAALARAEARGETSNEFFDAAPIVAEARRPSRNAADAETTLRLSLLARDGGHETTTLDVYVAKTGPRAFEAVVYDRDFAAGSGGFPYSAPPLSIDRLLLDPTAAALIAAAAGSPAPAPLTAGGGRASMLALAAALALACATLFGVAVALAAERPVAALASAGVGAAALLMRRRG